MDNWIITADGDVGLMHHGTKGMKWGQRLYQRKDGSLTALGKLRYSRQAQADAKTQRRAESERDIDAKIEKKLNSRQLRKNLGTMSDKELQDVINRKQKEKTLRDMLDAEISPGRKKANEILSSIGSEVAKDVGKKATLAAMDMALKKFTSGNATASEFVRAMKITDFKSSIFDDKEDSKPTLTGKKKQKETTDADGGSNDQPKQKKKKP